MNFHPIFVEKLPGELVKKWLTFSSFNFQVIFGLQMTVKSAVWSYLCQKLKSMLMSHQFFFYFISFLLFIWKIGISTIWSLSAVPLCSAYSWRDIQYLIMSFWSWIETLLFFKNIFKPSANSKIFDSIKVANHW